MAKYDVTYTCGHTDTIQLFGKTKDREWRLSNEEGKLCPDCYRAKLEADRIKTNVESAEANKAAGLPNLDGSEKSVAWAETIRKSMLDHLEEWYNSKITDEAKAAHPEEWEQITKATESLKRRTNAAWWIDNRINDDRIGLRRLINAEIDELKKAAAEPPAAIVEDAKAEATIYPERPISNLVAEISVKDDIIEVHYHERNDYFRQIMHQCNLKWDGKWVRKVGKLNGSIQDRAAEIGNKLLAAGFPVRIYDTEIRRRAISGEYEEEPKRWIMQRTSGNYTGWFVITWPKDGPNYYDAARKLPGSKYDRPNVVVPPESFAEVLDFASMYKFSFSGGAMEVVHEARKRRELSLTTGVNIPKSERPPKPGDKPAKLEIPKEVTIADEFRDEN